MRYLITGGAGLLGSHLAERLLKPRRADGLKQQQAVGGHHDMRTVLRRQFGGVVDVLIRGELRSEAQILVDQHLRLVVTLDNSLLDELKLEQLMRVHCRVDPSSVILAVAA